jgi:hypothetical protein
MPQRRPRRQKPFGVISRQLRGKVVEIVAGQDNAEFVKRHLRRDGDYAGLEENPR